MEILKEKILKEGIVLGKDILKVDSFLNHQVDAKLMKEIGKEFANYFKEKNITKIVTIEASGIAPAIMTAEEMNVPMIIIKKQASKILNDDLLQVEAKSFTKGIKYNLTMSKKYINDTDNVLIIDDFLANGNASIATMELIKLAGAKVAGIGIVIEKSFQPGREKLEKANIDVYSLARIKSLEKGKIEFSN